MPTIRALISATVFSLTTATTFSSAAIAAPQEHPALSLPEAVQGEAAITALGNRLPAVAAAYNMSTSQFARAIRTDDSMWLDTKGRVFYVEPDLAIPANEDLHLATDYPLSQTFALASRPESSITIYLDFDGHVLQNTAWNNSTGATTINAKPWTQDGDSTTFTDSELIAIQNIWRLMAEDFAPFDVNVTTIAPDEADLVRTGSSDQRYGTRVLFTPNDFYSCSCGGVAYVGVFDSVINPAGYYQPALVFNTGTKSAAEAGSHEAGHNIGLSHDGTSALGYYEGQGSGETGWAPIMGVGYYKSLVQWSKGEYLDANNTQDDYAVMASNGLYAATDDYGATRTTASYLDESVTGADATASGTGIIGTPGDIDGFLIVASAGSLSIQADPVAVSPNLDIGLAVYDQSGSLIASSNPSEFLAASLTATVSGGEYLVTVTGVGKGDPQSTGYSDYGSLGGYKVTANYTFAGGLISPTADISSDYAGSQYAPLTVNFDGSNSTEADSFNWSFGDGNNAVGVAASNEYTTPGTYTVTLLVESIDGLTDSATMSVTALNNPPVAIGAIVSDDQGIAPLAVQFSSAGSNDADSGITFLWNFGDGATSTEANPIHEYTSAGNYTVTLTVNDEHNGSDTTNVGTISVSAPPIVDSYVSTESASAGQVTGSYIDTRELDGNAEVITERESGGRKNTRYSYAEHSWTINVPAGTSTVYVTGYQNNSSDGDSFALTYQMGGASGAVGSLATTSSLLTSGEFTHAAGQLTISLNDSDQSSGNSQLDSAYIDQIFVRTLTDSSVPLDPPAAPTSLSATAVSASQIDLNWDAVGVDGEYGFRVERRESGGSWSVAADLPADSSNHSDSGLAASTTYDYRVIAFNGAGDSGASNIASATTDEQSAITLTLADTFKVKGANNAVLTWDDNTQVYSVYRDGAVVGSSTSGSYTDSDLGKGGMIVEYFVCNDSGACSNAVSVTF